jgi:hypothetical protein
MVLLSLSQIVFFLAAAVVAAMLPVIGPQREQQVVLVTAAPAQGVVQPIPTAVAVITHTMWLEMAASLAVVAARASIAYRVMAVTLAAAVEVGTTMVRIPDTAMAATA